jgi:hypothetical protein
VSVPLCLRAKASPFWIILLLVWANPEHLEPLTLNQRVPGSSPVAPTSNLLKNMNNTKRRWEPAVPHGIFGKLLGTGSIFHIKNRLRRRPQFRDRRDPSFTRAEGRTVCPLAGGGDEGKRVRSWQVTRWFIIKASQLAGLMRRSGDHKFAQAKTGSIDRKPRSLRSYPCLHRTRNRFDTRYGQLRCRRRPTR